MPEIITGFYAIWNERRTAILGNSRRRTLRCLALP
jgi:hypothetical protein